MSRTNSTVVGGTPMCWKPRHPQQAASQYLRDQVIILKRVHEVLVDDLEMWTIEKANADMAFVKLSFRYTWANATCSKVAFWCTWIEVDLKCSQLQKRKATFEGKINLGLVREKKVDDLALSFLVYVYTFDCSTTRRSF